ncbi:MAG: PP-loop domain-containing protein [Proteobacteria bacterium]|nr:PP-loop domain-containing protein [Pseudomonadota bacterium]
MAKVLTREVNRRIGRAMHDYAMLDDGDRVLVAVSGGVDSLVLAWLLDCWQCKAPIRYEVCAVHIDMEPAADQPGKSALAVRRQLDRLHIRSELLPAVRQPPLASGNSEESRQGVCYNCARTRRRQLFDFARQRGFTKLALGHHRDDIVETFFLNLCFAGNISTMVPRQDLFAGRLALIRPLAYLGKEEICAVAEKLGLEPVRSSCPLAEKTRRRDVRRILAGLYREAPAARSHIFAALANVRHDYLLRPSRSGRAATGGPHADKS